VLVWRHADDQYLSDARSTDVTLRLERLPFRDRVTLTHWRIDAVHSNSHAAWRAQGAPQDPTEAQLAALVEVSLIEVRPVP
jgi:xylan 1,4-beta-xylosidase